MLLLIACTNARVYLHGHSLSARGCPRDITGVDRVAAAIELMLVDGRAYPLVELLFGYEIVQLSRRRAPVGSNADPVSAVASARAGRRGSAEILLRRLTYGHRPTASTPSS